MPRLRTNVRGLWDPIIFRGYMQNSKSQPIPLAYFLTFTCYGTWLHGSKSISVDKNNNEFTENYLSLNPLREKYEKTRMRESAFILNSNDRIVVLNSIQEVCAYKSWRLLAAHVRTNHTHLIVRAEIHPEYILQTIKTRASKNLNLCGYKRTRRWTRHGSTRYLWKEISIELAVRYVVHEQGEPLAVFEDTSRIISPELKELIWDPLPAPAI